MDFSLLDANDDDNLEEAGDVGNGDGGGNEIEDIDSFLNEPPVEEEYKARRNSTPSLDDANYANDVNDDTEGVNHVNDNESVEVEVDDVSKDKDRDNMAPSDEMTLMA